MTPHEGEKKLGNLLIDGSFVFTITMTTIFVAGASGELSTSKQLAAQLSTP